MSKALVSFAVGADFEEMLEIARPGFQKFCDRHGYELFIPASVGDDRPPSWQKVPVLRVALELYDEVIWIDADAVILDASSDIPRIPTWAWHALVLHRTGDGTVPSAGFWFLRQQMRGVLDEMWEMTQYLHHPWWEQAALVELLGYGGRPVSRIAHTDLWERTFVLDNEWGVHRHDSTPVLTRRVIHASMWPDRIQAMRNWAAEATRDDPVAATS